MAELIDTLFKLFLIMLGLFGSTMALVIMIVVLKTMIDTWREEHKNRMPCMLRYSTGMCSVTKKKCFHVRKNTCKLIHKAYDYGWRSKENGINLSGER